MKKDDKGVIATGTGTVTTAAGTAILGALGLVGWTVARVGAVATGITIYKARKHNRKGQNKQLINNQ